MSSLNSKARNSRDYYNPHYDPEETRWGLRNIGSWPSDWTPRRTCQVCKKAFKTDGEEGFSDFLVDICASCIHKLVKKARKKEEPTEVEFTDRIDEITIQ